MLIAPWRGLDSRVPSREWASTKLVGAKGVWNPNPGAGVATAAPFRGSGVPGGKRDVISVSSTAAGMLLYVGCPVARAYPQEFVSPFDLVPFSARALDVFGQVHLIPQRTPGTGLHRHILPARNHKVPDLAA